LLDDSGFETARILASNELDEHLVATLKEQGRRSPPGASAPGW